MANRIRITEAKKDWRDEEIERLKAEVKDLKYTLQHSELVKTHLVRIRDTEGDIFAEAEGVRNCYEANEQYKILKQKMLDGKIFWHDIDGSEVVLEEGEIEWEWCWNVNNGEQEWVQERSEELEVDRPIY